jgi:monoamine oxidase
MLRRSTALFLVVPFHLLIADLESHLRHVSHAWTTTVSYPRAESRVGAGAPLLRALPWEGTRSEDGAVRTEEPSRRAGGRRVLQGQEEVLDAVIVGAGWAGLGAARALEGRNILVLEGRDYVGGRSRTVTLRDGVTTAELGSSWIVGANPGNPIYQLATSSTVGVIPELYTGAIYSDVYGVAGAAEGQGAGGQGGQHPNAHRVPAEEIDPVVEELSTSFYAYQEPLQESTEEDQPLRAVADQFVQANAIEGEERLALDYLLDSYIEKEYAANLQDLSLWWWNSDEEVVGGQALLEQGTDGQGKVRGYSGLVDEYAAPILDKIQLNAKVVQVDWNSPQANATGIATVDYQLNGELRSVRARHVILTVPLGVLKRGTIRFTPSLPQRKQTAIERLGMGVLDKVILKWDDAAELPWPGDVEWLERIAPLGQQGRWTNFFDSYPSSGDKVVVAWAVGREAERVEQLPDGEILAEVMDGLAAMFGDGAVPEPEEFLVTRWRADEFAAGSYSFYQVGSTKRDRVNLAAPLESRLYFAGEATSRRYFATTRGALETGVRMGSRVLGRLANVPVTTGASSALKAENPSSAAAAPFALLLPAAAAAIAYILVVS